MRAIPIEHSGKPVQPNVKETAMTEKTPKKPDEPVEQEFVPAPVESIIVEHNPKDPNSPSFVPENDES